MGYLRCAARGSTDVTLAQQGGRKRKMRKRKNRTVVRGYFPLDRNSGSTGCLSFQPKDGIIFLKRFTFFFFLMILPHPIKVPLGTHCLGLFHEFFTDV